MYIGTYDSTLFIFSGAQAEDLVILPSDAVPYHMHIHTIVLPYVSYNAVVLYHM